MGYFSSLMRQTGIRPADTASRSPSAVRGIEVEETRVAATRPPEAGLCAQAAAVPLDHEAPPTPSLTPGTARSVAPMRSVETVAAPVSRDLTVSPARETVVEMPAPPRTEIRELEVEEHTPELAAADEVMPAPLQHHETATKSNAAPEIEAVRVGRQEAPPQREKRPPTLAEVLTWVAQPARQAIEPPVAEPAPWRPLPISPVTDVPSLAIDTREKYSLEIGTIQILIDGPPESAPQRSAMAARSSEPAHVPWGRASRHYLRP